MEQNMLIAIDEDSLNEVSGGTGCLPSPCAVIEGVLGAAGEVVGDVIEAKAQIIDCGVQALQSIFHCPK